MTQSSGTIRSTEARNGRVRSWVQVDVDEPQQITGITCRRNRQLQARLWTELKRLGATKEQDPGTGVLVGGEAGLGTYIPRWSSAFTVGIPSKQGRLFAFTGTGGHEQHSRAGSPAHAFALLDKVKSGAGADGLWTVFADDAGYTRRSPQEEA
jgi:hypothetical protein